MNRPETAMNLSLGLTTSSSIERTKWISGMADALGLHGVWIGEDIGSVQEIFTTTSLALLGTRRVNVGIGVTSPFIRNVTTIARAAIALSEIAPKRFRLGLGVGGLRDLASMGIQIKKPTEMMRKTVRLLRVIWTSRGIPVSEGDLKIGGYRPQFGGKEEIPIFMGVRGPKLLAQAAELADGLILSGPKKYVEESIKLVLSRRTTLGLSSKFCFVLWTPTIMVLERSDLELVKKIVAIVAADTPDSVLEMAGIAKDEVDEVRTDIAKHGIKDAAKNISSNLVEQFCISGDAGGICESLRHHSKLGVDEVVFGPPYGRDPKKAITEVAETWVRTE